MKRINIFMLILSMILFLGILYDESQLIMLDFDNMSRRGFLNSEKIYYTERDMIAKSFTSYDEIITKASELNDSYVLIAKYNNAFLGVYAHNYELDIPLKSGRMFTNEELISNEMVCIANNYEEAIGIPYGKMAICNMLSTPFKVEDKMANMAIYSNVKLTDESYNYDPYAYIDPMAYGKHIIVLLMFILLFIILSISYLYSVAKTIIIKKFLGNRTINIVIDYASEIVLIFIGGFLLAILVYAFLSPEIIAFEYTRSLFISVVLSKVSLIIAMICIETLMIYLVIRFIPIKKIGWMMEYDD